MLSKNGEDGHLCLVLESRKISLSLSSLSRRRMLDEGFFKSSLGNIVVFLVF